MDGSAQIYYFVFISQEFFLRKLTPGPKIIYIRIRLQLCNFINLLPIFLVIYYEVSSILPAILHY